MILPVNPMVKLRKKTGGPFGGFIQRSYWPALQLHLPGCCPGKNWEPEAWGVNCEKLWWWNLWRKNGITNTGKIHVNYTQIYIGAINNIIGDWTKHDFMVIRLMIINGVPLISTPKHGPKYLQNLGGFFAPRSSWNSAPHPDWKGMFFFFNPFPCAY